MKLKAATALGLVALWTASCDAPNSPTARARAALEDSLLDPRSAQIEILKSTATTLCGTVNAKNRLGAYVGAQPFLVAGEHERPLIFSEPTISDYSVWSDNPRGSAGQDARDRLDNGCAFKVRWAKVCDAQTAEAITLDADLCVAWQSENWRVLRSMQRGAY